jgi:hypothetical protein
MKYSKAKFICRILFILSAFLPVACFKSLTVSNIVYENNFEAFEFRGINVGPVTTGKISNYNGTAVLGKFNNELFQLNLATLPQHTIVRVEFDLYIHNKWANDLWRFTIDGAHQLITGFSNDNAIQQSYPTWLNNTLSPAGANAQNTKLPGLCGFNNERGTSQYRIISTIPHTNTTLLLEAGDAGSFLRDTCQRSWSIDNLKISTFKN